LPNINRFSKFLHGHIRWKINNKVVDVVGPEAEKVAFVAKIQWDQKIMEKESEKKMAEIEGR